MDKINLVFELSTKNTMVQSKLGGRTASDAALRFVFVGSKGRDFFNGLEDTMIEFFKQFVNKVFNMARNHVKKSVQKILNKTHSVKAMINAGLIGSFINIYQIIVCIGSTERGPQDVVYSAAIGQVDGNHHGTLQREDVNKLGDYCAVFVRRG